VSHFPNILQKYDIIISFADLFSETKIYKNL